MQSAVRIPTYLQHSGDHIGKHAHRKTQDVEEGDGGEGLLCIQNIVAVHQDINRKCCHRHLERDSISNLTLQACHVSRTRYIRVEGGLAIAPSP